MFYSSLNEVCCQNNILLIRLRGTIIIILESATKRYSFSLASLFFRNMLLNLWLLWAFLSPLRAENVISSRSDLNYEKASSHIFTFILATLCYKVKIYQTSLTLKLKKAILAFWHFYKFLFVFVNNL